MLRSRNLDDQSFEDIVRAAVGKLPWLCPEWTDHNAHDPGITVLELMSWYKEMQQYHLNQFSGPLKEKLLKLAGVTRRPVRAAQCAVEPMVNGGGYPALSRLSNADEMTFELLEPIPHNKAHLRQICVRLQTRMIDAGEILGGGKLTLQPFSFGGRGPSELLLGFEGMPGETLRLYFEVEQPEGVARNPFAPGTPEPRVLEWKCVGAGQAELLREETHALSQSGYVELKVPTQWPVTEPMGLHWLCVRLVDAGCEEEVRLSGISATRYRAAQQETLALSRRFTVEVDEAWQILLEDAMAQNAQLAVFLRTTEGWQQRSDFLEEQTDRGRLLLMRTQDAATDGDENLLIVCLDPVRCRELLFHSDGLPGLTLALNLGGRKVLKEKFILLCATLDRDGVVRPMVWHCVDDLWCCGPRDRVFFYDSARETISFGDGLHGAVPARGEGAVLVTDMILTYGSGGNIPASAGLVFTEDGAHILNNAACGGEDRESIQAAAARLLALLDKTEKCASQKAPTTSLAVQLFLPQGRSVEEYLSRFARRDRFTELFDPNQLSCGNLVFRGLVLEFLSTGTLADTPERQLYDGAVQKPDGALVVQLDMARRLDLLMEDPSSCVVCLSGTAGSGKRFHVEHLMSRQRARCLFANLEGSEQERMVQEAALAARLTGAYLCCRRLDGTGPDGSPVPPPERLVTQLATLDLCQKKLFLTSQLPIRARLPALSVDLEVPPVTESERITLFRLFLKGAALLPGVTTEELSAKFRFAPRQIRQAATQAVGLARLGGEGAISGELIHRCCYRQVVHKLGELASPVRPAFTWGDVVMPESQKKLMQHACSHIQFQHQVYCSWGFDQKISYGRGLSILFAGAPGTGKTMCAQVIAKQLNMEMYKINISQIVSKYIGETEKNLQAVFAEAKNSNCILFFDECDALFGKRSEVKDSHDRNANMEVAYLLQQIEEHDGVCVLATNLVQNIDTAFMRRITYVVHFPFPDAGMREEIYRRTIPATAPLSQDVDWAFLAEKFQLSGGHIKNIVLSAAFMAAEECGPISMRHLLRAAVNELKKNEIVVVREELREYADLLDE